MTPPGPVHAALEPTSEVIRILEEYLEELEGGARLNPEELAARCPELAAPLKACLASLEFLQEAALSFRGRGQPVPPTSAENLSELGRLGDFHLVREVGRGGMGVVYEAEQISLGRRVALKVLPFAAALDARQLQRFKNEAQAAACLHHTNIVPVFGVGCERGVHYYAMQFIEGLSLAEVIADLRLLVAEGAKELTSGPPASASGVAPPTGPNRREPGRQPTPCNVQPARALTRPAAALSTEWSNKSPTFFRTVAHLGVQAAEALEHAHQLGVVHRDIKPANLLVETASPLAPPGRGVGGEGIRLWVTDFGLAHCQGQAGLTVTGDLVGTLRYMSPEQALAQPGGVDQRTDIYALGATLYELLTLEPAFNGRDRQELLRQIGFEEPRPVRRVNPAVPAELETIVLKALAKNPAERYPTARALADDLQRFVKDEPILARRPTLVRRAQRWARRHRPVVWSAAVALLVTLAGLAGSVGWVVRDQAARQAKVGADLQAAWEEAQRSRKEGKWVQARAAAKRAEALLQDGPAEPALAGRVRALLRELAEEEADRRLIARIEAIRLLQAEVNVVENRFALERAIPEFRRAFGDYGLRADALTPAEAVALLRRRPPPVRGTLVAALEHWLILAHQEKAPEINWLERVLSTADSDPWRQRVRAARGRRDRQALEQLAREVKADAQPPEALVILDLVLRQRGAHASAVALLRRAQEAHPGDFWINHNLGIALQDCRPPQHEEAVRFLTVAVALRPRSAGARLNLGLVLLTKGRLDEAAAAFRKAIALKHDYAPAHNDLGLVFWKKGRLDEAAAAFRRAVALKPDFAPGHFNLGLACWRTDRVDEAAAAFRRAIALKPDYAEAHCNLGGILRQRGEFARALPPLTRGHDLGSRRPDWPYPSARWVKECQRLVELDGRLPAVLRGVVQPGNAAERNEYAQLCYYRKLYVGSARLRADAFRADPKPADDLNAGYRYDAACAAALGGCGQGADAGQVDEAGRTRWRKQALKWLRADLTAYGKLLERGEPKDRRLVRQRLRHWRRDQDLAGLRDPPALARLPADERQTCERLWAEVRALLTRAAAAE
jgi:serine/threonine protein kinase/Flp pilus assembly protein TadD